MLEEIVVHIASMHRHLLPFPSTKVHGPILVCTTRCGSLLLKGAEEDEAGTEDPQSLYEKQPVSILRRNLGMIATK